MKLKKSWKITGGILVASIILCALIAYVNASTSVKVTMVNNSAVLTSGNTLGLSVNMTGVDNDKDPDASNIHWLSANDQIAAIESSEIGNSVTIKGYNAGVATITATYYSKVLDNNGNDTGVTNPVSTASIDAIVPLSISLSEANVENKVYNVGDVIGISANTYSNNPMVITTTNEGVVNIGYNPAGNAGYATVSMAGGGSTIVNVATKDANGNTDLMASFRVTVKVEFDPSLYNSVLDAKVVYLDSVTARQLIPSNIKTPSASGVTWEAEDPSILKTFNTGEVQGITAGVTKVTAGAKVKDVSGNTKFVEGAYDVVYVVIPFEWISTIDNMNVSDQFQLQCSGIAQQLTWTTTNNSILTVDSNGLVTAVGPGSATIKVARPMDSGNQNNSYGELYSIQIKINVIDTFGLSTTTKEINVDETFDLKAMVTNSDASVSFKVYNEASLGGTAPTYDIVKTSTSEDGLTLSVTGVAAGAVRIVATQNIKGLIKTAECVVYVRTPVGSVTLNPDVLNIDRGTSGVIQLIFEPASPYNDQVLWTSSDESVATVTGNSSNATIKGIKGGTATISVITMDGLKVASCTVNVREPVTGIKLNETSIQSTMAVGSYQLVATILPAGEGVNRNVTWTSSNTAVATVDSNGLVKFVSPGYTTIIAKTEDGSFIATCNVNVSIPVEQLKLDYTDEIMSKGSKLRITAEVLPITASNRTVAWSSSNTNVCIVDSNGLVEAVGTGNATILCKSLDGNATAMCNIYVKQPATSVVLNTTETTVRKGAIFWLNATVLPENADNKLVDWTSSNDEIASVDKDGKVTANAPGVCTIIATNTDTGLTGYCVVTVTQPVTGLKLNSDYQEMWVGSKYAIIPYVEPIDAENKNVKYESSDPTVASVNDSGVVTALKGGDCIIVVTTEECQLTATVKIDVKEYVTSVTLNETNKMMNINSDGKLNASVERDSATNKGIIWTSSNYDVVTVDETGYIVAVGYGYAVVTATAADGSGASASCVIRVIEPVSSITVEPEEIRLLIGDSAKATAYVSPDEASIKDVTWVSSNESVAIVDGDGEVFAVGTGKAKITAISQDGNNVRGSCSVYVTPVISIKSLKINSSEISMLTGKSRQLSVRITPTNTTESVTWYSTDTSIVNVDENGIITTVGAGTADVVCEGGLNNVSATCTIHSMALSQTSLVLEQYDSFDLYVDGAVKNVSWRSGNPRVATVTSSGKIVGRMAGTTTITATVDGKTMTCVVTVRNFR